MRHPVVIGLVLAGGLATCVAGAGCDRNVEPFDPDEQPAQPDLSRIFPAGAEREEVGAPGLPPAPGRGAPPLAAEAAAADGPPIRGTISLAPGLEGSAPRGGVLFLIARRDGGGPPLAVERIAQPSFPLEFSIGPEDRMLETLPFAGPMRISARLDADGNATSRQPGDLEGRAPVSVSPGASGVEIVLEEVLGQ